MFIAKGNQTVEKTLFFPCYEYIWRHVKPRFKGVQAIFANEWAIVFRVRECKRPKKNEANLSSYIRSEEIDGNNE